MRLLFNLLIVIATVWALDDQLIKKEQMQILQAKKRQIELAKSIEQYSLLTTPSLSYERSSQDIAGVSRSPSSINLSLSQDIFRSGGMYFTFKNATDKANLAMLRWQRDKNSKIYAIYRQVIAIQKVNLSLQKQNLLIANEKMSIKALQAKYDRGLESVTNLNRAIINLNNLQDTIYVLQDNKAGLISHFEDLSDKPYQSITIPIFSLMSKEAYLQRNHTLKSNALNTKTLDNQTYITLSRYLPKVSLFANYKQDLEQESSQNGYGLRVSWAFSANTFSSLEYANLATLQSQWQEKINKKQEERFFDTQLQRIKKVGQKIANKQKTIGSYDTIIKNTQELYEQRLRTKDDVDSLVNIQKIARIDVQGFTLDKTLLLITLYEKLY